jgi:hypothetical protein
MKKVIVSLLLASLLLAVNFYNQNLENEPSNKKVNVIEENLILKNKTLEVPFRKEENISTIGVLPDGATLVDNPMEDFIIGSGYSSSAINKFKNFSGKEILLLSELPNDEKELAQKDLADIEKNGFAHIDNRSSEEFYNSSSYVSMHDVPKERLSFQYTNISSELSLADYDYAGVISPHQDTNSDAPWNSMTQIYRKGENLISVDQGSLGEGGTAFITEGYDNVYLQKEYPASYLKNQSKNGSSYYSLYFSSGTSVFHLKSSSDNKDELIALAEGILKKS